MAGHTDTLTIQLQVMQELHAVHICKLLCWSREVSVGHHSRTPTLPRQINPKVAPGVAGTREQLDEACGNDKTKLPDDLAEYKMKACPYVHVGGT